MGGRRLILLFTDFGLAGPYVGQMKAVLAAAAPGVPVVDLMHDAPAHSPRPSAYLLAALARDMPMAAVCLAVVDPGVGGDRPPVVLEADGRWFVGPGNGLFELLRRRTRRARQWRIAWRPEMAGRRLSASFHGRDLFAPVAARLARGDEPEGDPDFPTLPAAAEAFADWPEQLAEIVYVDAFGNAMTGLDAADLAEADLLVAGGRALRHARVFSAVPPGAAFWYENSSGLAEIAVNRGSAAATLGLRIGDAVAVRHE